MYSVMMYDFYPATFAVVYGVILFVLFSHKKVHQTEKESIYFFRSICFVSAVSVQIYDAANSGSIAGGRAVYDGRGALDPVYTLSLAF